MHRIIARFSTAPNRRLRKHALFVRLFAGECESPYYDSQPLRRTISMLSRQLLGDRLVFLLWGVFATPFAVSILEWVILISRRRDQLRHVTVILAMAFSTMAALLGIWTLLHFPEMLLAPASTGHKVVFVGCLLATLAAFAALTWVVIERNWLSWMAFAVSGWMFCVWMLMLLSSD